MSKVAAVILCGGESRRMGRPKAWLPFGAETLLSRVVRLASTVAEPVVVVAAPDQRLPEMTAPAIVRRDPLPGRGPLQGLDAGLAALPSSVEFAYATAVDAPFLAPAWIGRLAELIGEHDVAVPFCAGRLHPLASLYRVEPTRAIVRSLLDADQLRLSAVVERLRARIVLADELLAVDPGLWTVRNLNTIDEYQSALTEYDRLETEAKRVVADNDLGRSAASKNGCRELFEKIPRST